MMKGQKSKTLQDTFQGFPLRLKITLSRFPLHLLVVGIGLLWMTPAFGLLVSSFRDSAAVANSGWWTAFQHPHFELRS